MLEKCSARRARRSAAPAWKLLEKRKGQPAISRKLTSGWTSASRGRASSEQTSPSTEFRTSLILGHRKKACWVMSLLLSAQARAWASLKLEASRAHSGGAGYTEEVGANWPRRGAFSLQRAASSALRPALRDSPMGMSTATTSSPRSHAWDQIPANDRSARTSSTGEPRSAPATTMTQPPLGSAFRERLLSGTLSTPATSCSPIADHSATPSAIPARAAAPPAPTQPPEDSLTSPPAGARRGRRLTLTDAPRLTSPAATSPAPHNGSTHPAQHHRRAAPEPDAETGQTAPQRTPTSGRQ